MLSAGMERLKTKRAAPGQQRLQMHKQCVVLSSVPGSQLESTAYDGQMDRWWQVMRQCFDLRACTTASHALFCLSYQACAWPSNSVPVARGQ